MRLVYGTILEKVFNVVNYLERIRERDKINIKIAIIGENGISEPWTSLLQYSKRRVLL